MLSVVPRKELGGVTLAVQGARCLYNDLYKTTAEGCFCFSSFSVKAEVFLDFFQVAKRGIPNVGLL